jgi:hypothetical protein
MPPTLAALVLYAFATGIFAVLSALERPIWRLMWNHEAPAPEGEVRRIHAALKGFIHILPPTMMTTMALALAALLWQLAARGFDAWGWAVLATFVALQGAISPTLLRRIAAVKAQGSDAPLREVRRDTARLAAVHHMGLGVTVAMTVLLLLTLLLVGS